MPLPRFYKLPDDRRRSLLDAAAHEFADHGFEGSSFNRIIAAAGVSKGAMYYYFADKADAYGAVLDDVLDRVEAVAGKLDRPTDAEGFWRAMGEGTAELNQAFITDAQLGDLIRGLYSSHVVDATYERLMQRTKAWVHDLLVLGQQLGAVRQDVSLELMTEAVTGMMAAVDRWASHKMLTVPPEELMEMGPQVLVLTRDMLEPRQQ